MASDRMQMAEEPVRAWSCELLRKAGLNPKDAEGVTASLLFAERRGIASHGLVRLRIYLQRIRAGGINPAARMRKVLDMEAVAVLDGDHAPGASAGLLAAELVRQKAQQYGAGVVVVRNGNHFGAAGFYAKALADAGLIGLVACNTDAAVAPPGGGTRVLGTNPLAIAIPATAQGTQPLLDMATSEVSLGKLIVARDEGKTIPVGWAVDRDGRATTDAAAGLEGALLPAAGHKGFGLAFMVDILSALGGSVTSPEAGRLYGPPDAPQRLGFFFLAIAPAFFIAHESLAATVEGLTRAVRNSRSAQHALGEPMVPGEPEARQAARAPGKLALGQPLAEELSALGVEHGVPFPQAAV